MSCITEILKVKGDKPYLVKKHLAVETGGTYKNYEYLITFTNRGHRCGYVAINKNHPLHGKDLMGVDSFIDLEVHGGVTFNKPGKHVIDAVLEKSDCDDIWIGFDAIHSADRPDFDLAGKLWSNKISESYKDCWLDGKIRSKIYMERECKKLIEQLIKFEETK